MDILVRRLFINLFWIIALFQHISCQTCGQTPCSGQGYYCCSKTEGEPKNCCCRSSATGFDISCVSKTSTFYTFPWWGAVLIVAAVVGIVFAIVFVIYRRKKRQSYGQI